MTYRAPRGVGPAQIAVPLDASRPFLTHVGAPGWQDRFFLFQYKVQTSFLVPKMLFKGVQIARNFTMFDSSQAPSRMQRSSDWDTTKEV